MWDRRIIGVPNRPGKKTIEIEIPDGGESWTAAFVAPRRQAEGYIGQNIDEIAVQTGAKVDELLEAIKQEGYFSSWVIIEECTID